MLGLEAQNIRTNPHVNSMMGQNESGQHLINICGGLGRSQWLPPAVQTSGSCLWGSVLVGPVAHARLIVLLIV